MAPASVWREKCISQWYSHKASVHSSTLRFCWSTFSWSCLSAKEDALWSLPGSIGLVPALHFLLIFSRVLSNPVELLFILSTSRYLCSLPLALCRWYHYHKKWSGYASLLILMMSLLSKTLESWIIFSILMFRKLIIGFFRQDKYAHDILKWVDLLDSKPIATPLIAGESLSSSGSPFHDLILYRFLVGALQYLTTTRPDLSYVVNPISQFLHSSTEDHFFAVKHILRYVKGTIHYGLFFVHRPEKSIVRYSDAGRARSIDTRLSTY